jgi:phage-related protein
MKTRFFIICVPPFRNIAGDATPAVETGARRIRVFSSKVAEELGGGLGCLPKSDGLEQAESDIYWTSLIYVQYGDTPAGAKPFADGLPHEIWKIVEDDDGRTYRAVCTAAFPEVVCVLDVFMKKSTSGIKTRQADKDRVVQRFTARPH